MSKLSPTPNGEGITMTPAMVSAGLAVYLKWKSSDDYREDDLMRAIFGAMTLASLTAMPAPQDMEIMQAWHSERERGTARDSFDYFAAGFQAARSEVLQTEPHDESKIASLCAWVHTMCAPEELSDYAIERALRAAIDYGRETTSMRSETRQTAKQQFDEHMAGESATPIERLRFFCSLAMEGQDWMDVEPFFDALYVPSATRRRLHSLDSYCPACGHNRDTSAISSVNNDDGTHYCQKCSTEWEEV